MSYNVFLHILTGYCNQPIGREEGKCQKNPPICPVSTQNLQQGTMDIMDTLDFTEVNHKC